MRTPSNVECKYFHGDYYRGRNIETCMLIGTQPPPHHWTPDLCISCPVPGILRANACEHMILSGKVKRGLLFWRRHVVIEAYCNKSNQKVDKPHIGCGLCHPLPFDIK
ncbi:MAG: hypothetical protein JXR32_06585 [Anaerolineaceae bacterium]|nr:hypothetical protein [Anaerolineaceae bacterium]